MHSLLKPPFRPGAFPPLVHLALSTIWIGLIGVYLCLAFETYVPIGWSPPRSNFRIPHVQIGNTWVAEMRTHLMVEYGQMAHVITQSYPRPARNSFWVDLTFAFLSLIGFAVQRRAAMWSASGHQPATGGKLVLGDTPALTRLSRHAMAHDGSFPDAGYSR